MRSFFTKKRVILLAIAALLLAAWGIYTRPMSVTERAPMLVLDKCTGLKGYYCVEPGQNISFTYDKDSPEFQRLWTLAMEQAYRNRLRNLLPAGTRTHPTKPGDFEWELIFLYDTVLTPDGSGHKGDLARVRYWFGELDLFNLTEDAVLVTAADQESWARQVLEIIKK